MANRADSAIEPIMTRRAFIGAAGATAAAALTTVPSSRAHGLPPAASLSSFTTIERYLGATRSAVEELEAHRNDGYYLGTPYGTVGPNQFDSILSHWDCWHPNGRPSPSGKAYMNCTGFIVAVLEACGANCDIVGSYVGASGYDYGNKANLSRWRHFLDDHADLRTRYESKEALLASGQLRKGDLIFAEPNDWSAAGADGHAMFFWGDAPDEDLAWHSAPEGDGIVAGTAPGNMISRITAKAANCYWLHVPLTNLIEVTLCKVSALVSVSGSEGANPAYSLEGAEFSIFRSNANGVLSDFVTSFTTDSSGKATVELRPGETVWVREDVPPLGYAAWTEPKQITVGETSGELTLEDAPCVVDVVIVKEDEEKGPCAQGWATLEGAVYELEDANGKVHRTQTAWDDSLESWAATFSDLPRGSARIREAVPPIGYRLDSSGDNGWHPIELTPDSHDAVFTVKLDTHRETVIRGDIVGGKYREDSSTEADSNKSPLAGCMFSIWLQDDGSLVAKGYDIAPIIDAEGAPVLDENGAPLQGVHMGDIESHEDGRFDTKDLLLSWNPEDHCGIEAPPHALPYGVYTLVETSCPDPALKLVAPITGIEVKSEGQEVFLILEDRRIASPVRVRKIDADSGKPLLKPGTAVRLLKEQADGSFEPIEFASHYPIEEMIDEFIIGEDGFIWFPDELEWGTYAIEEVRAIPPYLLSQTPVVFQVSEDHDWGDSDAIEVVLENASAHGSIIGMKTDSENGEGVPGARYEIRAAHDVTMPDGTRILAAGDVVAQVETDDTGAWRVDNLPLGDGVAIYEVRETHTPDGYVTDDETHTVSLEYENDTTPIVERSVDISEKPTELLIKKVDAQTKLGIEGVEFSIFLVNETEMKDPRNGQDSPSAMQDGVPQSAGEETAVTPLGVDQSDISEKSEPVEVCVTNAKGIARVLRLPGDATYLVKESKARSDLGYVLSDEHRTLYLSSEGRWYATRSEYDSAKDLSGGKTMASIEMENDFTKVAIYKVDSDVWGQMREEHAPDDDRNRLAAEQSAFLTGGAFRLLDENGESVPIDFAQSESSDTWSAAGSTPQIFTHLPLGASFTVTEDASPAGYLSYGQTIFRVEESSDVQTIVVGNRKIETLPRTLDGGWRVAAGLGIAAAGGTALVAYSRRRTRIERMKTPVD